MTDKCQGWATGLIVLTSSTCQKQQLLKKWPWRMPTPLRGEKLHFRLHESNTAPRRSGDRADLRTLGVIGIDSMYSGPRWMAARENVQIFLESVQLTL